MLILLSTNFFVNTQAAVGCGLTKLCFSDFGQIDLMRYMLREEYFEDPMWIFSFWPAFRFNVRLKSFTLVKDIRYFYS